MMEIYKVLIKREQKAYKLSSRNGGTLPKTLDDQVQAGLCPRRLS